MGRNVSMSDVARHAGVSMATVSNTLNHPEKVADATRQRIHDAIAELGFVRNDQARSLATGRSRTIGLIVTDIGNSYFVDIARGAEEGAARHRQTLLLANSDNDVGKEQAYLSLFDEAQFAGVLLAPFEASAESATRIRRNGRPVVVLNVATDPEVGCCVTVDDDHGGHLAARHLIERGCTRLAFVGGPDRLTPLQERRLGVERAVAETRGAVTLEELILPAVNTPEGREAGTRLIARQPADRPDGIVAASDLLALGIVQAFHGRIAVPDEIAVIGYDNNTAVRESAVPISTVAQPGYDVGLVGATLVCEELTDPGHRHREVRLPPHLIARRSSERLSAR